MKRNLLYIILLLVLAACGGQAGTDPAPVRAIQPTEIAVLTPSKRPNYLIYQVNPKLYGGSGAFGKIQARLDDIRALGTDILYLMPVYPEGRAKAIGSPYCIRDFTGVNNAYGGLEDLRALVNAAHAKGMKVLFDWVANHTAWDHPWITEHSDWYEKNAKGEIVCPTKDGTWSDVAQLNYANKDLWTAMTAALRYWIEELGIDGFRCDYAHGVRDDFWKDAISQLRALRPDLIMLAESDYTRMFDDGFDLIFDRAMKSHVRSVWGTSEKLVDFVTWYRNDLGSTPTGKARLFFTTNHDDATEASPIDQFKGKNGALAALVLMASLNGTTMVYGSQEAANAQIINFFNTQNFNWGQDADYTQRYQEVLSALRSVDRSGAMRAWSAGQSLLLYYSPTSGSRGSLIVVNTGSAALTVALPATLAKLPVGSEVASSAGSPSDTLPDTVSLEAYGYHVWLLQ